MADPTPDIVTEGRKSGSQGEEMEDGPLGGRGSQGVDRDREKGKQKEDEA